MSQISAISQQSSPYICSVRDGKAALWKRKWQNKKSTMRSVWDVSHLRGLSERKQNTSAGRESVNGEIKSAASASFAVFDGAEKEMFWIDNPRLW